MSSKFDVGFSKYAYEHHEEIWMLRNEDAPVYKLDYKDYFLFDNDLGLSLMENPIKELIDIKASVEQILKKPTVIEVVNLDERIPIRRVNQNMMGKLIKIGGVVSSVSVREVESVATCYKCTACDSTTIMNRKMQFLIPPDKCEHCNNTKFYIDPMMSKAESLQWVRLQEDLEDLEPGLTPQNISVRFNEYHIDAVKPGDRVQFTGWVAARRQKPNDPNPTFLLYFQVVGIEKKEDEKLNISEEDRSRLATLAVNPEYIELIKRSIAPTIYGWDMIKLAVALQQCNGCVTEYEGKKKRANIHVLMAGDPGLGKSEIMEWAVDVNQRGILAAGRGGTAAGLTASLIKDEETGQFTLMAGAMVLADGGLIGIDEIEKMNKEDRVAIHPAMEQCKIPINKGGINTVLNSRTSVLAACNPIGGTWNSYVTFTENVKGLPSSLLSRFDLIFVMRNNESVDIEIKKAEHVLDVQTNPDFGKPPISRDDMRRIFTLAREFNPALNVEARQHLLSFYGQVVKASREVNSLMITMRQMEGLIRLTEASAKLHLRNEAVKADAETAVNLVKESLIQAGIDPTTGKVDMSILESGKPQSDMEFLRRLPSLIDSMKVTLDGSAAREDVIDRMMKEFGIKDRSKAGKLIDVALRDGSIYAPRAGALKVVV